MIVFIANVLILFAIAFMVWKKDSSPFRFYYWPGLSLRVASGIAMGMLYKSYYGFGDTLGYDSDAMRLALLAGSDFGRYINVMWDMSAEPTLAEDLVIHDPRALFFTKWISLLYLITSGNYWLSATYLSLLSFLASWYLVREIYAYRPQLRSGALLSVLFLPSVIFWSSGLIKESLAMSCLYFIVIIFLRLLQHRPVRISQWLVLPFSLWILWGLKYYYLAVLLPVLTTTLLMHLLILPRVNISSKWLRAVTWAILFFIPLSVASVVHPNFYPERFLEVILYNYEVFVRISEPNDVVHFPTLGADGWSILLNAPKALYSGMFRPFIWEASNALQFLSALENTLLITMFLITLYRFKYISADRLLLPCLIYCVLLCIFLTLSTPNFGTLSRYRIGFLPFFALLLAVNNNWIKQADVWLERKVQHLVQ